MNRFAVLGLVGLLGCSTDDCFNNDKAISETIEVTPISVTCDAKGALIVAKTILDEEYLFINRTTFCEDIKTITERAIAYGDKISLTGMFVGTYKKPDFYFSQLCYGYCVK